jgi:hypothetical protein
MPEWTSAWCLSHGFVWLSLTVAACVVSCSLALLGLYWSYFEHGTRELESLALLIVATVATLVSYLLFVLVVPTGSQHWCALILFTVTESYFLALERHDFWAFTHILYAFDFINRLNSTLSHHNYEPVLKPAHTFGVAAAPSAHNDSSVQPPEYTPHLVFGRGASPHSAASAGRGLPGM